jgi:hypothetical protein
MGVIYAALLWWFMTRPHVVAAFEPTWSTAAGPPSGFVPPRARPDQPSSPCVNPYAPPAAPIVDTPSGSTADEALATIIPYRNAPALIAYYLGLFSLAACIPLVGLVGVGMAVAAVILGVKGLRRAAEHPDAKGRVHAWIGILGGAVCGAVGLLINMLAIIALLASITGR